MSFATILFVILSILSLAGLIFSAAFSSGFQKKNGEPVVFPAIFKWLEPENLSIICLVFFISFGILTAYSVINKCDYCNEVVTSSYCSFCGAKNDNYVEHKAPMVVKMICPECDVPCETPYCGNCGSKTIFVGG